MSVMTLILLLVPLPNRPALTQFYSRNSRQGDGRVGPEGLMDPSKKDHFCKVPKFLRGPILSLKRFYTRKIISERLKSKWDG